MNKHTANKLKNTTDISIANPLFHALSKLKLRVLKMISGHEARVASLRVYDATRLDGAQNNPDSNQSTSRTG